MSGTVSEVLVCAPSAATASDTACLSLGSSGYSVALQQGVLLSQTEYASFQLQSAPFDNDTAMDMFGSGLGFPVLAYVLSLVVGIFRNQIKKVLAR